MRKFVAPVLLALLTIRGFAQQLPSFENPDIPKELKSMALNKIQSVTYLTYSVKNDTVLPIEQTNESYYFNDGILNQQSKIDPVNKNVIYTKKYDSLERIISGTHFAKNAFRSITIYIYDELKRTTTMFVLDKDSSLIQKRVNFFNSKNKLIKTDVFDKNSVPLYSYLFQYNKNNDLIKSCFYNTPHGPGTTLYASFTGENTEFKPNPNDSVIYKYKYNRLRKTTIKDQYDSRLRLISRTVYSSKKDTLLTIEYSLWNEIKKPIRRKTTKLIQNKKIELNEHFDEHQNISSWVKFIYIDDDYMEGSSSDSSEKHLYRNEYQFDQCGNWIVKYRYCNDKLWSVTKRQIKYK